MAAARRRRRPTRSPFHIEMRLRYYTQWEEDDQTFEWHHCVIFPTAGSHLAALLRCYTKPTICAHHYCCRRRPRRPLSNWATTTILYPDIDLIIWIHNIPSEFLDPDSFVDGSPLPLVPTLAWQCRCHSGRKWSGEGIITINIHTGAVV